MILYTGSQKDQGRSDGGWISVFIPPKSVQVNFLWGKIDVRTAIQQFYTPQKNLYPQNKFMAIGYAPEKDTNLDMTAICCGHLLVSPVCVKYKTSVL